MKMRLFNDKKALTWMQIGLALITLAVVLVILFGPLDTIKKVIETIKGQGQRMTTDIDGDGSIGNDRCPYIGARTEFEIQDPASTDSPGCPTVKSFSTYITRKKDSESTDVKICGDYYYYNDYIIFFNQQKKQDRFSEVCSGTITPQKALKLGVEKKQIEVDIQGLSDNLKTIEKYSDEEAWTFYNKMDEKAKIEVLKAACSGSTITDKAIKDYWC